MGCLPLARFGDLGPDCPVVFGLEGGDELVALHAEEQRWRLAGPVADHRRIQIAILALQPAFTLSSDYNTYIASHFLALMRETFSNMRSMSDMSGNLRLYPISC
jgi:hypothetical protein